jgi:CheY-like chemotaxis protein
MLKVLIVDDNKDNRLTLRLLLEEYDELSIFEADNGKKAIETIRVASPDIVFMDIMMPIVDGIEATTEVRKFDKQVMIIAVSVLSDDEHKTQMLKAGAEDYITKPINEDLFKARMQNYISLIEHRRTKERIDGAVNLFSKDIYSKKIAFTINDEAGLAEFWEYATQNSDNDNICDTIRAMYNAGLELLKTNTEYTIVAEEGDESMFFSIVGLNLFNIQDIKEIFAKENSIVTIVSKNDEISISLPKALSLPQIVEKEKMTLNEGDSKILRMTHTDKISANNFAAELEPDIVDKLENLEANEETLDSLVYEFETQKKLDTLNKIASEIEIYAAAIDTLYEFKNLSYALSTLGSFIKTITSENASDEKKNQKLGLILRSIFADLTNWRKTVFVEQSTEDIHYLDSSLLSSCLQVELIFKDAQIEDEEELELF